MTDERVTPGPGHDPDIEPDGVVRTALQLLPIPAHDDDFWSRLETALDAEPPLEVPVEPGRRVLVAEPGPGVGRSAARSHRADDASGLAVVPPAFRRTSNIVLAAMAAAAAVVVAVAGTTLMDGRDSTSSGPSATPALETLVQDAQDDGSTVATLSKGTAGDSSDAVLAWVDDLDRGDADAAWSSMGTTSQAYFGTQSEFEAGMGDLTEAYGAWSSVDPDTVLVTPVTSDDDGTIAVVTLLGTVPEDGSSQYRADAIPVRIVDHEVVVEPFASAGDLEVVVPEAGADDGDAPVPVGLQEELVFVVPSGAEPPVLRLDTGDTLVCGQADGTELTELDQAPGQRCAYLPEGGFEPGSHTITVAFLAPDGDAVTAESIRFEAA